MVGTPSPDPTLDPQIATDARQMRDALPDLGGKGAFLVPATTGQLVYRGYTKSGNPRNPTASLLLRDPAVPLRPISLGQMQLGLRAFGYLDKMDNILTTRTVTIGDVTATLVVAGPSEFAPEGSLRLTWEQGGMGYVLSAWGLPEEQVLLLANALRPLS